MCPGIPEAKVLTKSSREIRKITDPWQSPSRTVVGLFLRVHQAQRDTGNLWKWLPEGAEVWKLLGLVLMDKLQ